MKLWQFIKDIFLEILLYSGLGVIVAAFFRLGTTAGMFALGVTFILVFTLNAVFPDRKK